MALTFDHLEWAWVLPAVAAAVALLLAWWARRPRRRTTAPRLPVAHAEALRSLPRYRQLLRRQRRHSLLLVLGALVVVAGAALVVARPQTVETEPRASRSRDLILCLDASASMDEDNATVVRELRDVVGELEGDRISLMLWSSATVVVFPLTDDYDYVRSELDRAEAAFNGQSDGFYAGVDLGDAGASLIGDGIVSCARRFDRPAAERTRVLLVASDNEPFGKRAYSLADAAALAADQHVLIYGIGAASLDRPRRAAAREEFADAATSTGGVFTVAGHDDAGTTIGTRIRELARARSAELPRTTSLDAPLDGAAVAAVGLLVLGSAWLTGRRRPR